MTDSEARVEEALRVYNLVLADTVSFEEENIGAALAYLMAAILKGTLVDVIIPPSDDAHMGPLWLLLRARLDGEDPIFSYFNRIDSIGD